MAIKTSNPIYAKMKFTANRLLGLVLAAFFVCSPVALGEDRRNTDAVQPILDRVAKMEFAEQQAWLQQLESRAARAARLSLPKDHAAQAQDRVSSLLHRETISWNVLRKAIETTNSLERDAVARLAEQYRRLVAEKFSRDSDEAGRRLWAWQAIYQNWAASNDSEQRGRLIDWLESAIGDVRQSAVETVDRATTDSSPPPEAAESAPVEPAQRKAVKQSPRPILKPRPKLAAKPIPREPVESAEPVKQGISESSESQQEALSPEVASQEGKRRRIEHQAKRMPLESPMESQVAPPSSSSSAVTIRKLPPGSVTVNADELAARIAGCNMGFRALEAELDEEGTWNARRIEPLVGRFAILLLRRNDLALYRELLPAHQRSNAGTLESPESAMSLLGSRIFEARRRASSPEFEGTEAERQAELARLEALSRRLAEAASG